MTTPNSPQSPGVHPFWKFLGVVGATTLGLVALSKIAAPLPPPPRPPRRARLTPEMEAWLEQTERLSTNRRNGRLLERAVSRELTASNPEGQVIDQFSVTGPDGRRQVIDHVVVDAKGTVTPYEVKNVARTRDRHVHQAERQHAALKAQGFPVGDKPALVVRKTTVVKAEHAERVDIFRANMRKKRDT